MSAIREEIVHVKGYPKKLVIFLHGYIDNATNVEQRIMPLIDGLENVAIHIPEAPYICEIYDSKRQWYSMHRFDPDDIRKTVPTIEDCVGVYERMSLGLMEAAHYINQYIDDCLCEYGLTPDDLFLCGFSQGAMMAIYISLMREEKIAGCSSFGGIIAPYKFLCKNFESTPDMLLIHGDSDNLVRFEALGFTQKALSNIGCNVETCIVPEGQHRISEEGIKETLNFIKGKTIKKVVGL